MSIFAWLKLGAAAAVLIIIGVLVSQNLGLKSSLASAEQTINDRNATIERANSQARELNLALATANRELALSHLQMKAADAAVAQASASVTGMQAALNDARRNLHDAPSADDAPAAPKLVYAAGGMRRFGEALEALRARYHYADGARGNPNSGGAAADPWPALGETFSQGQFAERCFDLGDALTVVAGNIAGIIDYQENHNKNVRQFNAASEGAAP